MNRIILVFLGVMAATLAGGAGFGFRRAQLLTAYSTDSAATADSTRADSTHSATADSAGSPAGHGADVTPLAPVDSALPRGLGAADDPAGAARAAAAAESAMVTRGAAGLASPASMALPTGDGETAAQTDAAPPVRDSAAAPRVPVQRLAKIFGSMSPRDAAKVLVQLDNRDVQLLIGYLSDRQAAAILGSIPPERAAQITGSTLRAARDLP